MKNSLGLDFGLIIAFLLPGFLFLYGLSFSAEDVKNFLDATNLRSTSIGAFFLISLGSLATGLLISAVRWLIVDSILGWIGIGNKALDFGQLRYEKKRSGFLVIVENHYRYYQYYANSLVSIVAFSVIYLCHGNVPTLGVTVGVSFTLVALALGAADSCRKYHDRAAEILGVKETTT